jgi:cyclic pyranopterin monophosphate synthase
MSDNGQNDDRPRTFPHLDEAGRARMVDVSDKPVTRRTAVAEGGIRMSTETLSAVREGTVGKGDVLAVARLAAIGGVKRTPELVPLSHPIPVDGVKVDVEEDDELPGLTIRVETTAEARTGVEMEALCGVMAGLLAVYDMCKSTDRGMEIGPVKLISKEGGRSGVWRRED